MLLKKRKSSCQFASSKKAPQENVGGKGFKMSKWSHPVQTLLKHLLPQRVVLKLCVITPYLAVYIAD